MGITRSSTKGKPRKDKLRCRYSIEVESNATKLVFDCRGCQGRGDLSDARCFGEAIEALRSEYNIDSIIFSNYTETNYFGSAMDALRQISEIMNEIHRFSGRAPWREMKQGGDAKLQTRKKICMQCERNPEKIFAALERSGRTSIEILCKAFNNHVSAVEAVPADNHCLKCIQTTKADLQYIRDKLEALNAHVLYHAFKVVEADR